MAFVDVTRFDKNTGEITGIRSAETEDILKEKYPFIQGRFDSEIFYVDIATNTAVKRPIMPIVQNASEISGNGQDVLKLENLPKPCTVSIGTHIYEVDDGVLEWSTSLAGGYLIVADSFPYLNWRSEVIVT